MKDYETHLHKVKHSTWLRERAYIDHTIYVHNKTSMVVVFMDCAILKDKEVVVVVREVDTNNIIVYNKKKFFEEFTRTGDRP
jgi:hypothetical protein